VHNLPEISSDQGEHKLEGAPGLPPGTERQAPLAGRGLSGDRFSSSRQGPPAVAGGPIHGHRVSLHL
jgi:hypothetical protein